MVDREELVRAEHRIRAARTELDVSEAERARRRRKQGEPAVEPFNLAAYFHKGEVGTLVVRRAELEAVLQRSFANYHRAYHQRSRLLDWEKSPVLRGLAWMGLFFAIAMGRVRQEPAPEQEPAGEGEPAPSGRIITPDQLEEERDG